MTWQIPQSKTETSAATPVVNLDAGGEDVFVGSDVTLAATQYYAIRGSGSGHAALIYGTVASQGGFSTIVLGNSSFVDSGQSVTIEAGGHVQGLDYTAVFVDGFASTVVNKGLVSALGATGVVMQGDQVGTTSTLTNAGTIEATGFYGVFLSGSETMSHPIAVSFPVEPYLSTAAPASTRSPTPAP